MSVLQPSLLQHILFDFNEIIFSALRYKTRYALLPTCVSNGWDGGVCSSFLSEKKRRRVCLVWPGLVLLKVSISPAQFGNAVGEEISL